MAYIKINDENKTNFRLENNPEESFSGAGYWYLKFSVICNLSADEFSEMFIPENLDIITMTDNQNREAEFLGYTQLINVRRVYTNEDMKARIAHITLQKNINKNEEGEKY